MKNSNIIRDLALGLALFPLSASATLVVAFNQFSNSAAGESQDFGINGFSGSISKPNASNSAGGSNDKTYGPGSNISAPSGNGYAAVVSGPAIVNIVYSILQTHSQRLGMLLFDAVGPPAGVGLSYQINAGTPVSTTFLPVANLNPPGPGSSQDYSDFFLDLSHISLNPGDAIKFAFTSGGGAMRVDNIALTAIPETASAMALALLIGGGLLTRNRRIAPAPALA